MNMHITPQIPTRQSPIPAYVIGTSLKLFCPFCERVHTHGAAGAQVGDIENRLRHCLGGLDTYDLIVVECH